MPVYAYCLMEIKGNHEKEVLERLNKTKGVSVATIVAGIYDIIAVVQEEDLHRLGDMVTSRIRTIAGVEKTTLAIILPAVEGENPFA